MSSDQTTKRGDGSADAAPAFAEPDPAERSAFNRLFYRNRRRPGWATGLASFFAGGHGRGCRHNPGLR